MTARSPGHPVTPFAGETVPRGCPLCSKVSPLVAFTRADGATFLECESCTLTFASPAPSAVSLERFYSSYYSDFRVLRSPSLVSLRAAARAGLCDPLTAFGIQHSGGVPPSAADVGCGQGARIAFLRELGVTRVAGCELDSSGVTAAKEAYALDVRHGDASTLEGERFRLVLLSEVIEHVLDPIGLLQQCARLLEPNGVLAISTPNSAARFRAGTLWKGLSTDFDHLTLFCDQSLTRALSACGLEPVECLPYGLPSASSERSNLGAAATGRFALATGKVRRLIRRMTASVRAPSPTFDREWGYTLLCAARLAPGPMGEDRA